ncbi:alpha/beta hydrolase [Microbulbifer yueqingensis]|uniref:Lysophospholipase, alpha-beta hydrolase superfamily n=1 Tax=Microbulbifer yueqingensis TaxID=658219 RepID=A0A1G9E8I3_9GAMM|nr:alpha/beta hydrolase [Microbulbifer yueqingensis]SDK72356.1 Lysophospholipase, alpha-beta hydrolase superfamily [Microbulbifer yueqingensis]
MQFVSQGDRLHYRRWWVEGALGVVVISHGLGEHSGRYRGLAQHLNRAGYSVYAPDHYGHGQSDGPRGHIADFARYSEHLHDFIRIVQRDNPGRPIHLLGHSMGGVIACGSVVRFGGVDSLVLSAPGFRGAVEPGTIERGLIKALAVAVPRLGLSNRLDPVHLSRDAAVVEDYRQDDLVHDRVTPRWFAAFMRERDFLFRHLKQITVPCLLLLPRADRMVDSATTLAWFDRIGSEDRQVQVFPDAFHEVFNEPEEGPQALELLLGHLKAHSPAREVATPA